MADTDGTGLGVTTDVRLRIDATCGDPVITLTPVQAAREAGGGQ